MHDLIHKYFEGKIDEQSQQELLNWLRKDENLREFLEYKSKWEELKIGGSIPNENLKSWTDIQVKIFQSKKNSHKSKRLLQILNYAAIFSLMISLPFFWTNFQNKNKQVAITYSKVVVENGQLTELTLNDSTKIWLKSGSSIIYNNLFADKNRDLVLEGEAYLKVSKNEDLPLILKCSDLRIKVLGTSFYLTAYPESNIINIVLEEGKIALSNNSENKYEKNIRPGEMVTYYKDKKEMKIETVNTTQLSSWKEGAIAIYDQTLEELVISLGHRYNQKFNVDDAAKLLRYTFSIKDETLTQVLALIKTMTPVDVERNGEVVHLKYNNQRALNYMQETVLSKKTNTSSGNQ